MSSYSVLISLLTIQLTVGAFGGYAGFTVNGVPYEIMQLEQPNLVTIASWAWNSVSFMWHMVTFNVDGVPAFLNLVFLLMGLTTLFLIVKLARGS